MDLGERLRERLLQDELQDDAPLAPARRAPDDDGEDVIRTTTEELLRTPRWSESTALLPPPAISEATLDSDVASLVSLGLGLQDIERVWRAVP
eukprot:3034502-Prymnesium_polylepis.1